MKMHQVNDKPTSHVCPVQVHVCELVSFRRIQAESDSEALPHCRSMLWNLFSHRISSVILRKTVVDFLT